MNCSRGGELDKSEELSVYCDICNAQIIVMVATSESGVTDFISNLVKRLRLHCDSCGNMSEVSLERPAKNPSITRVHLDSYRILMSEMTDLGLNAKLEWDKAQDIQSLLTLFGMHCDELDVKLKNPNSAVPSRGALWIELSHQSCSQIKDMLKDKVV